MSFLMYPIFTGYLTKEKRRVNSTELIDYLLDEANIAVVTGTVYGSDANIRLSYATSLKILKRV